MRLDQLEKISEILGLKNDQHFNIILKGAEQGLAVDGDAHGDVCVYEPVKITQDQETKLKAAGITNEAILRAIGYDNHDASKTIEFDMKDFAAAIAVKRGGEKNKHQREIH